MAPERSEAELREKKERREKKEKKRKLDQDVAPVEVEVVSEKKKKDKKRKSADPSTTAALNALEDDKPGTVAVDADGDVIIDPTAGASVGIAVVKDEEDGDDKKPIAVKVTLPLAAFVPFANPLCDDKSQRKVLKGVKKAAKHKSLKRGVKEVVKCIRKSPLATPSTLSSTLPNGIVILAADISPMDVISHIPVLCEDHNIPYMYVPSRAELGAAGATKRPTSVVMLMPKGKDVKSADGEGDGASKEEWDEAYRDLHKVALKLGQYVRV